MKKTKVKVKMKTKLSYINLKGNNFIKFTKFFYLIFIFLVNSLSLWSFDVYFEEKEVIVGKESTLVINASNFSGKVRGVINFGNFIIKWDCVYLNNQVIKYKITPSKTEGTVFFEFEDGKIFSKTFKIKDNKNFTSTTTYIYYVEEKNCFFNKKSNSITKISENKNNKIKNNNTYLIKTKEIKKERENYNYLFLFILFLVFLLIFIAYYFYKLGKEESKIEEEISKQKIPKFKKEILEIEKEKDLKKKAFLLYKLISNDDYLKSKVGENKLQTLYYLGFKKDLKGEDEKFVSELIKLIKGE